MIALILALVPQSVSADALLECMRLPTTGHFLVERHEALTPPTPEETALALRYAREHQPAWHARVRAEDPAWAATRPNLFQSDWVPLLLSMADEPLSVEQTTEFVEWKGPSFDWSMERLAQARPGSPPEIPVTLHRLRLDDELLSWTETPDGPAGINRATVSSDVFALQYASFDFAGRCEEAHKLVELARSQGGLEEDEDELRLRVDLRTLAALQPFSLSPTRLIPSLPGALHQMPGIVTGRFTRTDAGGATLSLDWTCFGGALVCSDFLRFEACGEFPSEMRRELRLPLADQPFKVTRSSGRLVPGSRPLRWDPPAGARVADFRFGEQRSYRVGPDGETPTDGELAEEAEREYLFQHQEALEEHKFLMADRNAELEALKLPWDTIDMGRQSLKSAHPVRFEIRNTSTRSLDLGDPVGDCTCLDISMPTGPLAPGAVAVLTARQQVLKAGPSETLIRVPYGSGSELEFAIQVDGVRAPVIVPDPIQVGRVRVGTPPSFQITVDASGCLEEGEHPVATAEGFEVQQAWSLEHDRWLAEITLSAQTPELLGAREVFLRVTGTACPSVWGSAIVLFESVPTVAPDSWPACRIVLPRDSARAARLRFPGTVIESVQVDTEGLQVSVVHSPAGDELALSGTGGALGERTAPHSAVVTLSTSRGPIRVRALIPSARAGTFAVLHVTSQD